MIKAFAPGNISCFFVVCPHRDPRKMGSLGAGIAVSKGVTATVKKSKRTKIFANSKLVRFPTVKDTINEIANYPLEIKLKIDIRPGCGFGMSGASALATAFAVSELSNSNLSRKELGMIAHVAEVNNKTGLGDVSGQLAGGVCIKKRIGNPLDVQKIKIYPKEIYYRIYSPLDTRKVITSQTKINSINSAGRKALSKISTKSSFETLVQISREFTEQTNLSMNRNVKNQMKNQHISMIMLGNAVFSHFPFPKATKISVVDKGAHLIEK